MRAVTCIGSAADHGSAWWEHAARSTQLLTSKLYCSAQKSPLSGSSTGRRLNQDLAFSIFRSACSHGCPVSGQAYVPLCLCQHSCACGAWHTVWDSSRTSHSTSCMCNGVSTGTGVEQGMPGRAVQWPPRRGGHHCSASAPRRPSACAPVWARWRWPPPTGARWSRIPAHRVVCVKHNFASAGSDEHPTHAA